MNFSIKNSLALAALMLGTGTAMAQAYPTRTMTWVVPFAAGGPTDALARDIADKVAKPLGQQIIIDNQAGAGGTIGTRGWPPSPDPQTRPRSPA